MATRSKTNKLVAGVGINDADYPVVRFGKDPGGKTKREWICPYYRAWAAMLNRCYRASDDKRYNAYKDTTVCKEWFLFSNFKAWMKTQDWEGRELDKDLLSEDNRYSASTCAFIPGWLNAYIIGGKQDHPTHLPGIFNDSATGVYYVNLHTKVDGLRSSQSFTDAISAISYYHKERLAFAINYGLDINLKPLVEAYFNRKLLKYLKVVSDNPSSFPIRVAPINSPDIPICGDRFVTNRGYWYTVTSVVNGEEITILFDDGEERVVSNTRMKRGHIRKSVVKDVLPYIKARIDKRFKWNSHGLLSGIQPYPPRHFAVSCKGVGRSEMKYFRDLDEAVSFRKQVLIGTITQIVGKDTEYLASALDYFENRWLNEVEKYSGKLQ